MTVFAYNKKQIIALGCCIEDSANIMEIKPCFIYILSSRKYIFDRTLSGCYSKYYWKQVSYDSLSNKWSKNIPTKF
jgi:hypothetical protein